VSRFVDDKSNYFLCNRYEVPDLIAQAERERDAILKELKVYLIGDISIRIYEVQHIEGISIAGDLMVNGELCRTYDPIDECFLDLNLMMFRALLERRSFDV